MARVALVTGGSRGIGEAISKALKAEGYEVAATYAGNDEKAAKFTEETGIKTYKWNVADYDASKAGIAQVEADLGPIDVVVANAGITRDATLLKMDDDQFDQVIDVNLRVSLQLSQAVVPGMKERGWGRIVSTSSLVAAGVPHRTSYAAAKTALISFTRSWALELARHGLTVNAVAPGPVATELFMATLHYYRRGDEAWLGRVQAALERVVECSTERGHEAAEDA